MPTVRDVDTADEAVAHALEMTRAVSRDAERLAGWAEFVFADELNEIERLLTLARKNLNGAR